MKMKILMVSKLLASTNTLVIASYTLFSLSTIYLLFLASFNYVNVWILISLLIFLMHHYLTLRLQGCLKLFKMQIALLILQGIFFIAIIML